MTIQYHIFIDPILFIEMKVSKPYKWFTSMSAKMLYFFRMAQQPQVGQGLLITEASRSHSDTPHSVGFLRMSDQPDEDTST
jgi:hypothetical protein